MGEMELTRTAVSRSVEKVIDDESEAVIAVDTLGGRVHVRWDDKGSATPLGQIAFFAEFLRVAGVFDAWVEDAPLRYTSPNAPRIRDVLGTWMLSALSGHKRYAHVEQIRADQASAQMLDIKRIVSDDALLRALKVIAKTSDAGRGWMSKHLMQSVQDALNTPWILDVDTTIKLLYGHQSGAQIAYNPHKPGRPSHSVHTYWVGNLRLVLDVEVQAGKASSAKHSTPGLLELLEQLEPQQRPKLVRADSAFGNEGVMRALEELEQPYLFKLKQTAGVKRLIQRQFASDDWQDAGQGWQAASSTLRLQGWSRARRVAVLRRKVKKEALLLQNKNSAQDELAFIDENEPVQAWEYAVLVTNSDYGASSLGQLYRDRADCENGFDELKNQWGLSGYSTQDIQRCNLSAKAVALVYNWWSWYCRLAKPDARMEGLTSRPLLLAAIGRMTSHGGQTQLVLSAMHAAGATIKSMIANIRKGLQHIRQTAPQLSSPQRWPALVRYIVNQIVLAKPPYCPFMLPKPAG